MDTLNKLIKILGLNITPETRSPIEIPNIGRDNLPGLFKELGFKVGAEIGVLDGEFAEKFLVANPDLKMYGIDPWECIDGFDDYSNKVLARSYLDAKQRLGKYNCTIIKKTSMGALDDFEDNSLDFVYIDGDHEFKSVILDICGWIKKVKVGGIIAGHDFRRYVNYDSRCHVVAAVSGYVLAYLVKPWFVLGSKEKKTKGEIRDKDRSWMWVKLRQ